MEDILDCFSKAPVFSKLAREDQVRLIQLATPKHCAAEETLCWQGDVWPYVAFLISGRLEWAMLSPDGRRQVVFKLNPCQLVWGHSVIDGRPMPASLEATMPSELLIWPREVVVPVVSHNVDAVWDVSRIMVSYMRHVREVVYGFAFHTVARRLARLLLDHYEPAHGQSSRRDLTLDQMADRVGTTRELVSRTLHRFADNGLIRINRIEISFTNRTGLEDLAERQPD